MVYTVYTARAATLHARVQDLLSPVEASVRPMALGGKKCISGVERCERKFTQFFQTAELKPHVCVVFILLRESFIKIKVDTTSFGETAAVLKRCWPVSRE